MKKKIYFFLMLIDSFYLRISFLILFTFFSNVTARAQSFDWKFLKSVGGDWSDFVNAMCVDDSGNVYMSGSSGSPIVYINYGPGVFNLPGQGNFIWKMDKNGNVVWAFNMTGAYVKEISVGQSGNIFLAGQFQDTVDFDPGPGVVNLGTSPDYVDCFMLKLDPQGNFIWVKQIGNSDHNFLNFISIDSKENVFIGATCTGTVDVDPGPGIYNLTSMPGYDTFLECLDSTGNFIWAELLTDNISNMVIDSGSNIYLTGSFENTMDFDPGPGTALFTSNGSLDIFILKLDSIGHYLWCRTMGGTSTDVGYLIAVNESGDIIAAGDFYGHADFDPDPVDVFKLTAKGITDVFIMSLSNSGDFKWAGRFGGTKVDHIEDMTVTKAGYIYSTGNFRGVADFDPGPLMFNLTAPYINGHREAFISMIDASGNFIWAEKGAGSSFRNYGNLIKNDTEGNVFAAGYFSSAIITWGPNTVPNISLPPPIDGRVYDSYVSKISCNRISVINIVSCSSYTSPSGNNTWTSSGIYHDTIPSLTGCDSILTVNLTIGTLSSASILSLTGCSPYLSPSGLFTWTSSGSYTDTIPNAVGCDSVITINLTLDQPSTYSYFDTACNEYISPSAKYKWHNPGIHYDTLTNSAGCDSLIIVNLFLKRTYSWINDTACTVYHSPSGLYTWNTNGKYKDTIPNAAGCDSVITIQLYMNRTYSSVTDTGCTYYYSPSGLHTWTTSGVHKDTISNAAGCDSVITFHLTFLSTSSSMTASFCDSIVSPSGNYIWTQPGTYHDTLSNSIGCDSIITVQLVSLRTYYSQNIVACGAYFIANHLWTQSGSFNDTLVNSNGCDSIITTHLIIIKIDTNVTQNGNQLHSVVSFANYQWLNCNNGMAPVNGATGQYFSAPTGSFAVIVTQYGCSDTSSCFTVIGVGTDDPDKGDYFSVLPNPASDEIAILSEMKINADEITIRDITGKLMPVNAIAGDHHIKINVKDFAAGIYFLEVHKKELIRTEKLVISR